ncbi:MAG: cardiolipin synthase [Gammaproteobacteria bacterium]
MMRIYTPVTIVFVALVQLAGCAGSAVRVTSAAPAPVAPPLVTAEGAGSADADAVLYRAALGARRNTPGNRALLDAVRRSIHHATFVAGNRVTPYHDGPAIFAAYGAAIQEARHHVHVETYIFADDSLGRSFADLLMAKREEGVEVRVLYDAFGSLSSDESLFRAMTAAGVEVEAYHPVETVDDVVSGRFQQRDHRKLLIVDGKTAFVGGVNISGTYNSSATVKRDTEDALKDGWRDTQVRIEGPVVQQFQAQFFAAWAAAGGEAPGPDLRYMPDNVPVGTALVAAVVSNPADEETAIHGTYLAAFTHARSRLWITQPYFLPDESLKHALLDAARRGVDVRILLPSVSDSVLTANASRTLFSELLDAGVRLYLYEAGFIHAKIAVIDDGLSMIGSSNLDLRSLVHNNEITAVIVDGHFADRMSRVFRVDLERASRLKTEKLMQRTMLQRLKERAAALLWFWI